VSRQELEKLALYAGEGGMVDADAAMACVGDSTAVTLEDVAYAAAGGDAAALERALQRALQEGESPVSALRAAMRHLQRLHLAASRVALGASEDEAMKGLRPPVFYKLQDRFKRQLRSWPPSRAAAALALLTAAEVEAKRSGPPPETVCHKALLDMARVAGAGSSRRG
jgi:DNA polymerase-3 subunit delta